jgi:hypothetical protein
LEAKKYRMEKWADNLTEDQTSFCFLIFMKQCLLTDVVVFMPKLKEKTIMEWRDSEWFYKAKKSFEEWRMENSMREALALINAAASEDMDLAVLMLKGRGYLSDNKLKPPASVGQKKVDIKKEVARIANQQEKRRKEIEGDVTREVSDEPTG